MKTLVDILQWTTSLLFLALGLVALWRWDTKFRHNRLLIFGALSSIGVIGLTGRFTLLWPQYARVWSDVSLVAIMGSGWLLMEFRHTVLPMSANRRRAVGVVSLVLLAACLALNFPTERRPTLTTIQQIVGWSMIVWWLGCLLAPAIKFWTASRARRALERARLRLLALGYGGIVLILLVAIVLSSLQGHVLQMIVQLFALGLIPMFYLGLAPPAMLRRRWLVRETERERARMLLTLPAVVWTIDTEMRTTSAGGEGMADDTDPVLWERKTLAEFYESTGQSGEAVDLQIEMHRRALAGETVSFENEMRGKAFQIRLDPLYGPTGDVEGAIGVAIDVTQRRQSERALLQALEREREAAHHLRALDDMKNAFLSAVSHELRTPLTAVVGFASTLESEEMLTPEERRKIIGRLIASSEKLQSLLGDLLDLDRLRRGILEPRRSPTDVGALVRHVGETWTSESGRTVVFDCPVVVCAIDAPKVERIVENLLGNAAKYTAEEGRVWVVVRREGDGVLVCVDDEGPGVPAALAGTIFEPFRQGERPAHAPGVGIGLSLVANFAGLHGGRAWVQDRPGGGASFRVWLADAAVPERRHSA
jgi:signal transduction histidine kinase